MTTPSAHSAALHCGSRRYPACDMHTVPLGYERDGMPAGTRIPIPPAIELTERLARCETITAAFHGKLGDTLLALSALRAVLDSLALHRGPKRIPVFAAGPHAALLARTGLIANNGYWPGDNPDDSHGVVGDRAGLQALSRSSTGLTVVCDPAAPPCWESGHTAYPELPARYYLAWERRTGLRLPADRPFAPRLRAAPNPLIQQMQADGWLDGLTIAAVTATSWPQLKDYTGDRFTELALRITDALGVPGHLILVSGNQAENTVRPAAEDIGRLRILRLGGIAADDLVGLFPHCDLVVGNDTGLTHLAALARHPDGSGPPVIGLYARHSHSKWRTGWPHHHAIATGFSERMHQGDLCPVRDSIAPKEDADLSAITVAQLAEVCLGLLDKGYST